MPLIKRGALSEDPWRAVGDDDALPATGLVLVSLDRWRAERDALLARNGGLGVRLASHQLAETIAEDAGRLDLIAIDFPSFRDGRGYSTARLLRERYGYCGELRAMGNVLFDQLAFMQRCGFDAFAVPDPALAARFAAALAEMTYVYQPAADGRPPISRLRSAAGRGE